jgi:HAE1 family hydrophobic/amphiphilic exporter-1
MSLEQAVQIALENNLDLKVARMTPQLQDYALQSLQANFRPTVSGTINQTHSATPNTDANQIVSTLINNQQNYTTTYQQNLGFWGASYNANFTSGRTANNNPSQTRNPNLSATTRVQYTQPLLANFRIDANRNALRVQQVTRQTADITLQQTIENTKASVRTAYWALRQAIEAIEIQKRSLDLAQRQYEDNKTKVEIGTMAPIDIVQNESTIAGLEQGVLNATINWKTAELVLKRLLVSGNDDPLYQQTINPSDLPGSLDRVPVDIPKAIQTALAERTDLQITRKNIEASQFTLQLRRNALLPTLNLTTSYQLQGQGGNTYSVDRITGVRTLKTPGGYSDALTQIGGFDAPTWTVSANFTYPLGMMAAKAAYAQAQIQFQQSEANLKAQELTVSTDVNNAGLAVQNAFLQVQAARKTREASERTAEATQTRFDVGMANSFEVATAVNQLTSARLNELNAVIRYVNAIADFEKKQRVGGGGS